MGLTGGVDTVVEIKKDKNERRTYSTLQRYHKRGERDIDNMVIKLAPDEITLHLAGSVLDVKISEIKEQIIRVLKDTTEEKPYNETEIREIIKREKTICLQCLRELHEAAKIERSGKGKKADPYKYWIKKES